jgi:quinol---cytochrome c reductase iron-sulfur subunit, bacillus type
MTNYLSINSLLKSDQTCLRNCTFAPGNVEPGGSGSFSSQTTRRGFLKLGTAILSAFVAVILAVPIIGTIINHAFRKKPLRWSKVGSIAALSINQPESMPFPYITQDAYIRERVAHNVWVIKHSSSEVTVFSPICPHLGCYYDWRPEKNEFICPCHGSIYSISGNVQGGPAPRPLDTLPYKLEGEELFVEWEVFKVGVPGKIRV